MKHRFLYKVVTIRVRYDDYATLHTQSHPSLDADIFVIKRTAMQLLVEFIGRQKIRLVGVGVSKLRERDEKQTMITDFT